MFIPVCTAGACVPKVQWMHTNAPRHDPEARGQGSVDRSSMFSCRAPPTCNGSPVATHFCLAQPDGQTEAPEIVGPHFLQFGVETCLFVTARKCRQGQRGAAPYEAALTLGISEVCCRYDRDAASSQDLLECLGMSPGEAFRSL